MIRPATLADMPALLALGRQMHAEGRFAHAPLDELKVAFMFERCIEQAFLQVNDGTEGVDAMFAGQVAELWFSQARSAFDTVFFVRPSRRGGVAALRLIQAFVGWGRERGAVEVVISQSSGVRVEEMTRLLTGMGFAHVGGVFKWEMT